ncbi:DUF3298 domain-containing protein [Psychrobacillus sp.]|uniref:RsiV family protein n=1 Tax=Psychrobacillus sp. TaxID=1871623 RepID=UPI0028BF04EC|nr:DUF3298 domain-containing protein [Psychrobacillus sp.]
MKKIQDAKKRYEDVEIPSELKGVVEQSILKAKQKSKKNGSFKQWGIGVAAAATLFVASVNVSPALAHSLATVPVLGSIVQVITIQEITFDEETYNANLKTPNVVGLENKELENMLNEKYTAENEVLYEQFQSEMKEMEEAGGGGHLGVDSHYEVITDTDDILSISRYEVNTVGSSSTTMRTDTIDKKNEILITLPSLFKNDGYVEAISTYIKEDMIKQMAADEDLVYWVGEEADFESFEAIRADQTFSITADHKLTISFDKYEVAPGYMGVLTFEIPTEVIAPYLTSDYYIK